MSREQSGGLSLTTILLASAGAATASIVVPLVWEGGGVVAAAITPVIVALTSEGLKRPVQKVQTVGVWRRTPQGTVVRQPGGRDFDPVDPEEERIEVDPEQADDPFGLREPQRRAVLTRRRVMLALVTAALAFAIAAIVVTASELTIFGDSVSRPHRTTFFGGTPAKKADATPTPTPTATPDKNATPTPTPSATPGETPTPTPTAGASPTPTPSVAPAVPAVPGATPAPTP
jgi:hypothetical protein